MNKEELILKWLNRESMSSSEMKAFEELDVYQSVIKIGEGATSFRAPEFNQEESLQHLLETRNQNSRLKKFLDTPIVSWMVRIAAIFILGFAVYFIGFTSNGSKNLQTTIAETKGFNLPDQSRVVLNAASTIAYDKEHWKNNRSVKLEGEAYFKVAKGKKFDVKTKQGTVSVLGTEFNVINRGSFFQVQCYEGRVGITVNKKYYELTKGQSVQLVEGTLHQFSDLQSAPSWLDNVSSFKSVPLYLVIEEFERQYGKKINYNTIDSKLLFTGNFVNSDFKSALQSIIVPMQLKYSINHNIITLYKD
ncbi:FecR family protein [Aquimarina sp. ERC-38]|uniref:FecR family protein n=1 Tax=Aquimarina sp. ERC-38 TaxID=2949996 RepID=UPI002245A3CB|nr:FecR family protein [Aquimarina sp. ERC-38]UZO79232.1 FecR family protein [Aquimarina sp. ERC-38]